MPLEHSVSRLFGNLDVLPMIRLFRTKNLKDICQNWVSTCALFRPDDTRETLEIKHRFMRDIYLRLISDANGNNSLATWLSILALWIYSDLYGSDVMSAHELARDFTCPVTGNGPIHVTTEMRTAHDKLVAKRKPTSILRSKAVKDPTIKIGDIFQIFLKTQNARRKTW